MTFLMSLWLDAYIYEGERLSVQPPAGNGSILVAPDCHTTVDEVLVKLVRVVANASIGAEPGYLASIVPECVCLLIDVARNVTVWDFIT